MRYRVTFDSQAFRALDKLPPDARQRVITRAEALADDPRPSGCKHLVGRPVRYRIRCGEYRLVYQVKDDVLLVLVLRVAHRKRVYKDG